MRFRKRIAALLCAALILNIVAPVSAAEVKGDVEEADSLDMVENLPISSEDVEGERYVAKDITGNEEINKLKAQIQNDAEIKRVSWDDALEFMALVDSTISNNKYRLKSTWGSVSEDDFAYLVDSGKLKYSLVDVNGNKIKGLKKEDIWWRSYLYIPSEKDLVKSPECIPVNDGVVECKDESQRYNRVVVFARYDGMTSMSEILITRPTKYFGRFVNHKLRTRENAARDYKVGEWIDIDNIQKLIGATSENAVSYMFKRRKVSGNNYLYSRWAIPETAAIYKSDNRPSDLIGNIRKGAYAIRVNKPKNYDAVKNIFGSVTAFRPKKKGIYKVTYIVPDGYNKKFTVKVRVTD